MIDFCVQRRGSVLLPVTASDEAELKLLPQFRVMNAEISADAPLKLKRWYRSMIQLLTEATGKWPDRDAAHTELMIRSGYFDSFILDAAGNLQRFKAQSTVDWDIVKWRAYLDAVIPLIIRDYVGETRAEFRDRVDRYLGIKLKEVWES